jgi:hypothetical protein
MANQLNGPLTLGMRAYIEDQRMRNVEGRPHACGRALDRTARPTWARALRLDSPIFKLSSIEEFPGRGFRCERARGAPQHGEHGYRKAH